MEWIFRTYWEKLEILDLLEKLALVVELVEVVVVELVFSSSTFSTKVLLPKIEADNFFPALSKSWMYWIKTSVSGLIDSTDQFCITED